MSSIEWTAAAQAPPRTLRVNYQRVVNVVFAIFVFSGMMSIIEPSPYDFTSLLAMLVWFMGGFRLNATLIPILFLWVFYQISGFVSLMPYWHEPDPWLFQMQSLYLFTTVVFFSLFFSENTLERSEVCLKAFTAGAIVSAIVGLIGYFNVAGLGPALTVIEGRVSATFKDPNVFGSYLTLATTFVLHSLYLRKLKHPILSMIGLGIMMMGVFLSFSRGSWAANIGAMGIMTMAVFITAEQRATRRRIGWIMFAAVCALIVGLMVILSIEEIRTVFLDRFTLAKDYDQGETGRFGNQARGLSMLLDRPLGFGPLRFRLWFDLEPHNTFISAFANNGWAGGLIWIFIVVMTSIVGFRLMFVASPFRSVAQVFFPPLFALLMQGFQIDIDHWRQLYLAFGAVWGLEAARMKWAMQQRALPSNAVTA